MSLEVSSLIRFFIMMLSVKTTETTKYFFEIAQDIWLDYLRFLACKFSAIKRSLKLR